MTAVNKYHALSLLVACSILVFLDIYRRSIYSNIDSPHGLNGGDASPAAHSNAVRLWQNISASAENALITCDRKGAASEKTITEFYKKKKCSHDLTKTVTFFHVGKGGGGTVNQAFLDSHIGFSRVHPKPPGVNSMIIKRLQQGPATDLVVNVRDPVDRFISAFRWRMVVLCHPRDERDNSGGMKAVNNPHKHCKIKDKEEKLLRKKYRSNPNVLAEALCKDSPLHKNATKDYSLIGHSSPLSEWLQFMTDPKISGKISDDGIQRLIAVPLEKQVGGQQPRFEQHIQRLQLHLLQIRYDEETALEIMEQNPKTVKTKKKKKAFEHSSVAFFNSTNTKTTTTTTADTESPPSSLSPLGECCLARHLREDYRIIQTMIIDDDDDDDSGDEKLELVKPLVDYHPVLRTACLWGSMEQQEACRSDLKSMLLRRARYLDLSRGTCSKVVAESILARE